MTFEKQRRLEREIQSEVSRFITDLRENDIEVMRNTIISQTIQLTIDKLRKEKELK